MAQIRHELHQDVQGVVRGAEATTDWRRYVRNYPWAMVGIAFGVGYLIVPRRHKVIAPAIQYVADAAKAHLPAEAARIVEPAKKKGRGIIKTLFGLATPFVLRTAQGYAVQYFEQFLAQKMAQQQGPFADLAAQFMPQAGGPPPDGPAQPAGPRPPA